MIEDVRDLLNGQGIRMDIVVAIVDSLHSMGGRDVELFYRLCLGETQSSAAKAVGMPQRTACWVVERKFRNIRDLLLKSMA